jgi:hypothetical protein
MSNYEHVCHRLRPVCVGLQIKNDDMPCHVGSKAQRAYCLLEILWEELVVPKNPRRDGIVLMLEFKETETPWLDRKWLGSCPSLAK